MVLAAPSARAAVAVGGLDTDALRSALPEEAEEWLGELSPTELPGRDFFSRIPEKLTERVETAAKPVMKTAGIVLLVCVFVSLSRALEINGDGPEYILFAGVAAIGAAAMGDVGSYMARGADLLQSMCDYARVVLPVLSGAAAASGSVSGAAAKYGAAALAMDILLSAARSVAVPCVGGYAALSLADAAVGNDVLRAAKRLLRTMCTTLTTAIAMGFTAALSLTHVVSAASDTLSARLAKTAVSTALPVVGGILADAAGSLTAAAGLLRGSVGVFGILAIAGICLSGVIPLLLRYAVYKLAASLCSCVADKRVGELVGDLGVCFGLMLALNGAGALMLFVSFYSLMRTVL